MALKLIDVALLASSDLICHNTLVF